MENVGLMVALAGAMTKAPTAEQVTTAVDAWLDDHPEATTTVQDGAITNEKLASSVRSLFGISQETSSNSGYYISGTSNKSSATSGRMSDTISLAKGEKITVHYTTGTTVSIAVIAKVNDNSTYTLLVGNNASASNKDFSYQAKADINVVVSWLSSTGVYIEKYTSAEIVVGINNTIGIAGEDKLTINLETIPLIRTNGYRKPDGTTEGTTTTYFRSSFTLHAGDTIRMHYTDSATNVSILGYFDELNVYHNVITGAGVYNQRDTRWTAPMDCTVSVSGTGSYFSTYSVKKVISNSAALDEIERALTSDIISNAESRVPWQYALDSVLCIGDSLTAGVPPDTENMPNPMKQCYPYYLERMINTDVTNAGKSGKSTSQWYNGYYSDYDMEDYNAVVIFLGTNAALTDTIETDVDPYGDNYASYATTETGYYCKLIKNIQHDNSNAMIVLVNLWSVAAGADTSRTVINKIGEKYSLPVVNTYDLRYAANKAYHGNWDNVHMTKAGYLALAHRICTTLKDYYASHTSVVNNGMTRRD